MNPKADRQRTKTASAWQIVRQGVVILLFGALLGLVANRFHPRERLPWIATKPYDITVPCPEPVGSVTAVGPRSPWLTDSATLLIDARSAGDYARWHLSGAINVPFDWLGPPVEKDVATLAQRVAASHAQRIVIYGDGDDPDSGREWARLLAGGGIRNVSYVEGGAPLLRPAVSDAPKSAVTPEPSP